MGAELARVRFFVAALKSGDSSYLPACHSPRLKAARTPSHRYFIAISTNIPIKRPNIPIKRPKNFHLLDFGGRKVYTNTAGLGYP